MDISGDPEVIKVVDVVRKARSDWYEAGWKNGYASAACSCVTADDGQHALKKAQEAWDDLQQAIAENVD